MMDIAIKNKATIDIIVCKCPFVSLETSDKSTITESTCRHIFTFNTYY